MKKKLSLAVILVGLAMPTLAETWEKVPLMDQMCLGKFKGKDPDTHPTSCLIKCADSGYGILTAGGGYLKFDSAGNEKTLAALKTTKKKDHVRVSVTGDLKGDTIQVSTVAIPD